MNPNTDRAETTPALSIRHLNKAIGKRQILKDISLECRPGEVFGFLGPNGAGKTTTIRLVCGLIRADSGEIEICGENLEKQFEKAMSHVGAIVENPEHYRHMTGWQNLKLYQNMRPGISEERMKEVVHLVGLENRIHEQVRRYSLGMRQRLGVAQALLHRPNLLILDEPTNGLDPAGIRQLRDILKETAHQEGTAVLVSSHLMSEMEMMCDRVGIIVQGKVIGVQTVEEMIDSAMGGKQRFVFQVNDPQKAKQVISQRYNQEIQHLEENRLEVSLPEEESQERVADIIQTMVQEGIRLYSVSPVERKSLEDVFLELTEKEGKQIG